MALVFAGLAVALGRGILQPQVVEDLPWLPWKVVFWGFLAPTGWSLV